MRSLNLKLWIVGGLVSVLVAACGEDDNKTSTKSTANKSKKSREVLVASEEDYKSKCQKPKIFDAPKAKAMSAPQFYGSIWGRYELDQVHIYHQTRTENNQLIATLHAVATRFISDKQFRGISGIRDTDLSWKCDEFNEDAGVLFATGVTIPVATVVHLPSGRVTVFDEGGVMDNAQFNMTAIADVHFDSLGSGAFVNSFMVEGPPYFANRYLNDVVARYTDSPTFYLRETGGFEMRLHWVDDLTVKDGKKIRAESSIVITYKRYEE